MNKEEAKKQIDADGASINGVKLITTRRAKEIIDAIDDHPKVKLPREVGEDLEDWLAVDNVDDILNDLVCDYEGDHQVVRDWWDSTLGATYLIADMARYGWEAEPEAKWYVQTPKEWWAQPDAPEYMSLDQLGVVSGIGIKKLTDKFTRAELKKYRLDSDIFTLVPVEYTEVSR